MRGLHSIALKIVQSGEIALDGQKCQRVRHKQKKVENIGNSYFPALVGPLFAREEKGVIPDGNTSRGSENMRRLVPVIDEHY